MTIHISNKTRIWEHYEKNVIFDENYVLRKAPTLKWQHALKLL